MLLALVELFTTNPMPRLPLRQEPNRILVIGAGVSGLTTAWALLDRGFRVKIVAKNLPTIDGRRIASQISGAL
jgi:glycine/D-amino acid oxidase-like deaminating enzyme